MSFEEVDHYGVALGDVCSGYAALRPPKRLTVAEGATNLIIKQPGGFVGAWSADEAPYMVEPMNMLASRVHEAVCFVGPARTGKTMGLVDGWLAHVVVNDPGDMLVVQMTQDKAREYSRVRVDRALDNSPVLRAMKSPSAQDDNTHDKMFRHGMWLRIAWPTATNLSGSDYRYAACTDYDRVPDDIDGEGTLFALALKRTQTYMSRGMCMVESSPGRDLTDPSWKPATPHEGPPVGGILGIYNMSDRRRWYWTCPSCRDEFEVAPGLSLFGLPREDMLLEMVREVDIDEMARNFGSRIICPHCEAEIPSRLKHELNRGGRWLTEGEILGKRMNSSIAGYWMGGVAAAYQSWKSLVGKYLQALRLYSLTGQELQLQTTVNTDQGMPYMSMILREAARGAAGPADRKDKSLERYVVPDWTRVLVASVDNQGGQSARFIVQVHAIGPHMQQALVDRYEIKESKREGIGSEFAPLDPAAYEEDWDLITERVVRATYRTSQEGVELRVKLTVVDTGGEDGATEKAYAWYRRMRALGLSHRVMLVKGGSTKNAPIIRESLVGVANKALDVKGDIPLYVLNPNLLKDAVHNNLTRREVGPGYMHFPSWLSQAFFDELNAEVRQEDGTWKQIRKRNESLDLCCYIYAGCLRLGLDKITDWTDPPLWLLPLFENPEILSRDERRALQAQPVVYERRSASSPYVQ